MESLKKLLEISTDSISVPISGTEVSFLLSKGGRFRELAELLQERNGFYAFESALHVFPCIGQTTTGLGLVEWNEPDLWKRWYLGAIDDVFFFAEDTFGCQFGIKALDIVSFDPETGEITTLADSFEEWARGILGDYATLTGFPLAHEWQKLNGPIPEGKRLLPKIPFALGGKFEAHELYAIDSVKGMRYRGDLWGQLRNLPPGTRVQLKVLPLQ